MANTPTIRTNNLPISALDDVVGNSSASGTARTARETLAGLAAGLAPLMAVSGDGTNIAAGILRAMIADLQTELNVAISHVFRHRPGETPQNFTFEVSGMADFGALVPTINAVSSAFGNVYELNAAKTLFSRDPTFLEPSRVFACRTMYRRTVNGSNQTVVVRIAWLDAAGAVISTSDVDSRTATVALGAQTVAFRVPSQSGDPVSIVPPTGTMFFRIGIVTAGANGVTQAIEILTDDITDAAAYSPSLTATDARVTALESTVASLSPLAAGSPLGLATLGADGILTRTQRPDKYDRVANVMDFEAVGDGVTDDYTAIRAAVDSLRQFPGGTDESFFGVLRFPPVGPDGVTETTFRIATPLVIGRGTDGLNIVIESTIPWVTTVHDRGGVLWYDGGSATGCALQINPGANKGNTITIRNMEFDGASWNGGPYTGPPINESGGAALRLGPNQFNSLDIENTSFAGAAYGIDQISDLTNPRFKKCFFAFARKANYRATDSVQSCIFEDCNWEGTGPSAGDGGASDGTINGANHIRWDDNGTHGGFPWENVNFVNCVTEVARGPAFYKAPGSRWVSTVHWESQWYESNYVDIYVLNTQDAAVSGSAGIDLLLCMWTNCQVGGNGTGVPGDGNNNFINTLRGTGTAGSRSDGLTFINNNMFVTGYTLTTDDIPSGTSKSRYAGITDVTGDLGGPTLVRGFLHAFNGGNQRQAYEITLPAQGGGNFPLFANPRDGIWCGVPLQLWTSEAYQVQMEIVQPPSWGAILSFTDITSGGGVYGTRFGNAPNDPSTGSWGVAQAGTMWLNTTTKSLKMWDGTAIRVIF